MTELRPTRRGVVMFVVLAIGASISGFVRALIEGQAPWPALLAGVVALAIFTPFLVLFTRNARVFVDEKGIRTRSMFGNERTITAHRIRHIVVAHAVTHRLSPDSSHIAVLDAKGEPLVRLFGLRWDPIAFVAAARPFEHLLTVVDEPISVTSLTDRYPLVLPFVVRRPFLTLLAAFGAIAALAIVVVSLIENF